MAWHTKEHLAKIQRISELSSDGLNTPRMFFVKKDSRENDIAKAMKWAEEINLADPEQIFNIRTYARNKDIETVNTTHLTDITLKKLMQSLLELNIKFDCMIDAETPDNGRMAGNILISVNEFGRPILAHIEYCEKKMRAMVRDHNEALAYELPLKKEPSSMKEKVFAVVISNALKFTKKEVILEWTWFCKPTGILNQQLVFWEYRKFI